jgi:hypothetical protein
MFGFGDNTEFEEAELRGRLANERLRENLLLLKNGARTDASHVLFFDMGDAGLGTLHEVVTTLMACVDALSARVAILENQ